MIYHSEKIEISLSGKHFKPIGKLIEIKRKENSMVIVVEFAGTSEGIDFYNAIMKGTKNA